MAKLEQKITFGIYKNIDIIGKLISKNIITKELEYYITSDNQNRKVDILCYDVANMRDVFIEVQLSESDYKHSNEFLTLLSNEKVNNCDFVWIAKQFNSKDVNLIKTEIVSKNKNISLYLIAMNDKWLERFRVVEIRDNHVLDDLINLADFNEEKFRNAGSFSNEQEMDVSQRGYYSLNEVNNHHNHLLLRKIIAQMRRNSQYLPFHFYKNLSKSRVVFGAGVDSVSAVLGTSPHRRTVFFSIEFNHRKELFERVLNKSVEIKEKLNYLVQINKIKNKIFIEIPNSDFTKSYLCEFFGRASQILLEEVYAIISE